MIVVKNLTKVYKTRGRDVRALNNVSFTLPDTGMVFIVGKSGSGKSTLLNLISGLDKITSGQVIAGGNSLDGMTSKMREKYLSSYIGYVFQLLHRLRIPGLPTYRGLHRKTERCSCS